MSNQQEFFTAEP